MSPENPDGTLTVERVAPELDPRQEWLAKRKKGIGGSDAAAILGLSPWKSPLALWSEKTGLIDDAEPDDLKEWIEWGHVLEEPIARKYVQVTGRILVDHGRYAIRTSEERPWMHCTIDREIMAVDADNSSDDVISTPHRRETEDSPLVCGPGDLSIKNAGAYKAKDWEDEPPLPYQVQLQHELVVTGMLWGSFAVLIGGNKFAWMDFPRNERFCQYLIEKEEEFWDRVQRGSPPMADASDSTKEILLRLYPKDTGESRELPPEASDWIERRRAAKAAEKAAQEEIQEAENLIKAAIGDATIGLLPDGNGMSWKHQHRNGYSVAPTEFRVLREIKAKKGKP